MTQAVVKLADQPLTVTDEQERTLSLSPTGAEGTRLYATADRLRLGAADEVTARVHGDDLRPWVVRLEVEQLEYHTADLARVTLRARGIKLDEQHRQAERTALGGHARLVAISCQDVVDGDVVEGSIVDVSSNGVALRTQRRLRVGDRLTFTGRFFATVIEAEVRVARVSESSGLVQAGCTFIEISPEERRKLRTVTAERPADEAGAGAATFTVLQELAAARLERERDAGFWRRLLRRSA
jgi:PilZ domain